MEYIDSGKEQGAKVHHGGGRHGKEGFFIEVHRLLSAFPTPELIYPFGLIAYDFHANHAGYEDRPRGDLWAGWSCHQIRG